MLDSYVMAFSFFFTMVAGVGFLAGVAVWVYYLLKATR